MTRLKRREKKYLGSLVALFEHEEKQLRKYRVVAKVLTILGSALFGMALIPVMQADERTQWFFGFGAVGGLLVGLGTHYHSAVAQWPVVKRFLDFRAIKQAYDEMRP